MERKLFLRGRTLNNSGHDLRHTLDASMVLRVTREECALSLQIGCPGRRVDEIEGAGCVGGWGGRLKKERGGGVLSLIHI